MSTPAAVELRQGALRLALRPDLGGAIAGLWLDDLPVLRSVEPATLASARESASYALVPYSNRIGERQFQWRGRSYTHRRQLARRAAFAARRRSGSSAVAGDCSAATPASRSRSRTRATRTGRSRSMPSRPSS